MKSKMFSILLSAVVAFGLWLYVITVVTPESEKTYYEIPVVLQNKETLSDRGLIIVSETPKVTLALKGKRSTLNDLNEANINVITNVANIEKAGTHHLTYDIAYPGNISKNDITVLSSSTDLITVKVENKVKKLIPVEIDYGGTTVHEGYIADLKNAKLDHEYVEVTGPESTMKHIHKAIIKDVDLTNRKTTLTGAYAYTVCNADGIPVNASMVTTNVDTVNLTVTIERMKQIVFAVDVIYGGGVNAQTVTITIDPLTLWVSGTDEKLEQLGNIVTIDTIEMDQMLGDEIKSYEIKKILPEGITNRTGITNVTVDFKFQQLAVKTFNVTSITAINVPYGLDVEFTTKTIEVTVRGSVDMVNAMKASDISVVVNFSQAQKGAVTMVADISINKNFSDVGAIRVDGHEYEVTAILSEAEPKTNTQ